MEIPHCAAGASCCSWYPSDPSYFWTSKILVCRSAETSPEIYVDVVHRLKKANLCCIANADYDQAESLTNLKVPILSICKPDPRPHNLYQDIPQISNSIASTNWMAVLIATDDLSMKEIGVELHQFQMGCVHRGIEKCSLLVISSKAQCYRESPIKCCDLRNFGLERGIGVDFLTLGAVAPADVSIPTTTCNACGFNIAQNEGESWAEYISELRNVVARQIHARLESDGVELSTTDTIKGDAAQRKKAEARLKKQRAECSLLLRDYSGVINLANGALEIYKTNADGLSLAQCHELIASALCCWYQENNTLMSSDTSVSPGVNIPPVFDQLIKEALTIRRNAGGGGGLLQILGPAADSTEPSERRSSRRQSVVPCQGLDLVTTVINKYRDAIALYQKLSPSAACVTSLCCASVLSEDDRLGALDVLTAALETALKSSSIAAANLILIIAYKFQEFDAKRKAVFAAFLATQKFSECGAFNVINSSAVACAADLLECSLALAGELDVAPLIKLCPQRHKQGPLLPMRLYDNVMMRLGHHIRLAYKTSRVTGKQLAPLASLRDSKNVYGWPAVQLVLAENLRKLAEYLKQPVAALWLAMVGFAAVANAFDSRTQTTSQRTLVTREGSLTLLDRLVPIKDSQGVVVGYKSTPWLLPPSVSFISKGESFVSKYLLRCYPGSVGVTFRRFPNQSNLRYSHFGGLSRGHYVPHLLALEPRQGRRVGIAHFRSNLIDTEAPKAINESIQNAFLFQPWNNDDPKAIAKSTSVVDSAANYAAVWAVGDLYSVCVRVRNTLATDILLDGCKLEIAGSKCQSQPLTVGLPPAGFDMLFDCLVIPLEVGYIHVLGLSYLFSRIPMTQFLFRDTAELGQFFFNLRCKHNSTTVDNSCPHRKRAPLNTKSTSVADQPLTINENIPQSTETSASNVIINREVISRSLTTKLTPARPDRRVSRLLSQQVDEDDSQEIANELARSLTLAKSGTDADDAQAPKKLHRRTSDSSDTSDSTCPLCSQDQEATEIPCSECLQTLLSTQHYSAMSTILVVHELPKLLPTLELDGDFDLESAVYEGETITANLILSNSSTTLDADLLRFVIRGSEKPSLAVGDPNSPSAHTTAGVDRKAQLRHGTLSTDIPGLSCLWSDGVTLLTDGCEVDSLPGIKATETGSFKIRFRASAAVGHLVLNIYYSCVGHSHWRWDVLSRKIECRRSLIVSLLPFYLASEDPSDHLLVHIGVEHYQQGTPFKLLVKKHDEIIVDHEIPVHGRLTKVPLCVPRSWVSNASMGNVQSVLWSRMLQYFSFEWLCGNRQGLAITFSSISTRPITRSLSTYRRALTDVIPVPNNVSMKLVICKCQTGEELAALKPNEQYTLPWSQHYWLRLIARTVDDSSDKIAVSRTNLKVVPALQDSAFGVTSNADFVVCGKIREDAVRTLPANGDDCLLHQVLIRIIKRSHRPISMILSSQCELTSGSTLGHSQILITLVDGNASV